MSEKIPICTIKENGSYIDGPKGTLVTDQSLINTLKQTVLGFWLNRKNDHFQGPLPVSLERENLYKLKKYPYLVCFKSDGIRFMMLCYDKLVYMFDRSFTFYQVDQYFKYIFSGQTEVSKCSALFDGELVLKNVNGIREWAYIIYDCICINFNDVSQETLYTRHDHVKNFIELWSPTMNTEFKVTSKKFYKFSEIDQLIEDLPKLDHKEDGLIFTPATLPIGTQTQYTLFKWKKKNDHTFDFRIIETDTEMIAQVNQGKIDIPFASIEKNTREGQHFIKALNEKCPLFKSGDIVECSYDDVSKTYVPNIHRMDKAHPNSLFTIDKIILNISENITFDEIISYVKN